MLMLQALQYLLETANAACFRLRLQAAQLDRAFRIGLKNRLWPRIAVFVGNADMRRIIDQTANEIFFRSLHQG